MLRDCLAGQARLRGIPLRERIVLALAAAEADQVPVAASHRDLAEQVGADHMRSLRRELAELVRTRRLSIVPGSGTRPTIFRLRPVEDWLEVPWHGDRRGSLAAVAVARESRRNRQAVASRAVTGSLGPYQRAGGRRTLGPVVCAPDAHSKTPSAPVEGAHYDPPSAPVEGAHKHDGAARAHCFTERDNSLSLEREGGRTPAPDEHDRGDELVAAVSEACGVALAGAPVQRLRSIAAAANGNFADLLELARAPGLRSFNARIDALERRAAEVAAAEPARPSTDPRRRTWEQALAGAIASGDAELESEAREMLRSMET